MTVIKRTNRFKKAFTYQRKKYNNDLINRAFMFILSWYYDVYKIYDEKVLDMLFRAIELYKIQDLHPDNVGYLNGKPIILDYIGIM